MKDSFGRSIEYLRLSITHACNHQCFYCRGSEPFDNTQMSISDILRYTKALVRFGVRKIRITGGEPLMREDCVDICKSLKGIEGLDELCLTTNASLLAPIAQDLKNAGVDRINISLNTLKKDKFSTITPTGNFDDVIDGFNEAKKVFDNIKLNVVLMKGINDDEIRDFVELTRTEPITVRFIEFMPIGMASAQFEKRFIPSSSVLSGVKGLVKIKDDGVSQLYKLDNAVGRVGLINPVSCKFCSKCNRLRLTDDGKLRMCLHSDYAVNLKGLSDKDVDNAIKEAISKKPYSHHFEDGLYAQTLMNNIGG